MPKTILRKKKDKPNKTVQTIAIPDGYTTVQDLSNDCDRCDFDRTYLDEDGNVQHRCAHPDVLNAGCVDGRIVFKKINK